MPNKSTIKANEIKSYADAHGVQLEVRGSILTASKQFEAGSNQGFTEAESVVSSVIYMLPTTSAGSVWGSDGASVGGFIGLQNGSMKLNVSGGSKLVLNALKKVI